MPVFEWVPKPGDHTYPVAEILAKIEYGHDGMGQIAALLGLKMSAMKPVCEIARKAELLRIDGNGLLHITPQGVAFMDAERNLGAEF